jgi:hypothetical protein
MYRAGLAPYTFILSLKVILKIKFFSKIYLLTQYHFFDKKNQSNQETGEFKK